MGQGRLQLAVASDTPVARSDDEPDFSWREQPSMDPIENFQKGLIPRVVWPCVCQRRARVRYARESTLGLVALGDGRAPNDPVSRFLLGAAASREGTATT